MGLLTDHTGVVAFASDATIKANIGNKGYKFKKAITDPFTGVSVNVVFEMIGIVSNESISSEGKYFYSSRTLPVSELLSDDIDAPYRDVFIVDPVSSLVTCYVNDSSLGEIFTLVSTAPLPTDTANKYVMDRTTGKKYVNVDPLAVEALWMEFDTYELESKLVSADIDLLASNAIQDEFIADARTAALPVGSIVAMASTSDIIGSIRCDGSQLDTTLYSDLFSVIGETYNDVNDLPSTTSGLFRVPDFRGVFLRGLDNGRGLDTGRALGTFQSDAIRNITGTALLNSPSSTVGNIRIGALDAIIAQTTYLYAYYSGIYYGANIVFDASWQVPTAAENRPVNQAVEYWIKY